MALLAELLEAYKEALVASDEARLRSLEAEHPMLILARPRLRELAWYEHCQAEEKRNHERYREDYKAIDAENAERAYPTRRPT